MFRFPKGYCSHSFHPVMSTKLYGKYGNLGGRGYYIFDDPKWWSAKFLWHFEIVFLTRDHIGLEISKYYCSYSFYPTSANFYEDIAYHGNMEQLQDVTFLGNWLGVETFVALWNFSMGVNGIILKGAISWIRLIVQWNWWKFGTSGPMYCILCVRSAVFRCTLKNFRCESFQKSTAPPVFVQLQPNFMESMVIRAEIQAVILNYFLSSAKF